MTTDKPEGRETWILGDEKDGLPVMIRWPVTNGLPVMIRWPVTNGRQRFNVFTYEEAEELKALLNARPTQAAYDAVVAERDKSWDKYGRLIEHMTDILRLVRTFEGEQLSHAEIVQRVAYAIERQEAAEAEREALRRQLKQIDTEREGWKRWTEQAEKQVGKLAEALIRIRTELGKEGK